MRQQFETGMRKREQYHINYPTWPQQENQRNSTTVEISWSEQRIECFLRILHTDVNINKGDNIQRLKVKERSTERATERNERKFILE